jgi:Flp pilus assembly pilin Flp
MRRRPSTCLDRVFTAAGREARALVACDRGDDLLEYALLSAIIGVTGIAVWRSIRTSLGTGYSSRTTASGNLWVTPDPVTK